MKQSLPEVKQITSDEVLAIRHQVMWPHKSIDYVKLAKDKEGRHFGVIIQNNIVAVISIFVENNAVQFRKFATLQNFQGLGYGSFLLNEIITRVQNEGHRKIWCNARAEKATFYEQFNLKATRTKFIKGGISYVVMENTF